MARKALRTLAGAAVLAAAFVLAMLSGTVRLTADLPADPAATAAELAALRQLDESQRAELLRAYDQWTSLDADQRQALRALDRALRTDPQRAALEATLQRYYEWLQTLSPGERAELLQIADPQQRLEKVRQLRESDGRRALRSLSAADKSVLLRWLAGILHRHLPPSAQRRLAEADPALRPQMALLLGWRSWQVQRGKKEELVTDEDLDTLRSQLSPAAQASLHAAGNSEQQKRLVRNWMHQIVRQEMGRTGGLLKPPAVLTDQQKEDLARFFEELPADERDRLQRLPPDELQRQLWMRYLGTKAGDRVPWLGPGKLPDRPRPGPPRRPFPEGPDRRDEPPRRLPPRGAVPDSLEGV